MRQAVFLCSHGGAKSVIASAWFNRLAGAQELPIQAVALASVDPYSRVPEPVAAMLAAEGDDVSAFHPRLADPAELTSAEIVVAIDCDVQSNGRAVLRWDDVPMVSEDLPGATRVIRGRVESLIASLRSASPGRRGR
jgi:arsenate reductase